MASSWETIYQNEIRNVGKNKYFHQKIKRKKQLINLIQKYSPNKQIIETGCGSAIISTYLASLGYSVSCVDIDEKMINIAKSFTNSNKNPEFIIGDIRNFQTNNHYDVSFSNGVFEHFKDDEIMKILDCCKKFSNYCIVGIPTKFFNKKESMYGNERYMSKKDWTNIFIKANVTIVETKYNDFRTIFKKIFQIKKWFKPKPYLIFVLQFK